MKPPTAWLTTVVLILALMGGPALAGDLVIKGSTTVLPIAQKAAEDYMKLHPELNISVSGGGSGNGIKAIIDGTADIADSSRFVKSKEIELAGSRNVFLVPHRVALDCVVPVVHPSNSVKDLSMAQLRAIYTGKISNWNELGGTDKKIVVISRDTSSGTYEVWEKEVLKGDRVMPKALLQASNGAVAQAVANNKYAIAYLGIGYVNDQVKALTVDQVTASVGTAQNGAFPISRALFMFTSGWPTGDTMDFIHFVVSPAGQKIVKEEGFVPLY